MKFLIGSIVIAFGALSASGASAQTQPQPQPQTAAPTSDPVVCQRQEVIGTRLASRRICMPRSAWQDRQLQDRKTIEKAQSERTILPPH